MKTPFTMNMYIRMNYARTGLCDARITDRSGNPIKFYPIKLMQIGG